MNEFIKYLNGLHNYNAQNQNAYGEKNKQSKYYDRMQVTVDVSEHIVKLLEEERPHIIILTGHAGDGKTSIMYQVLSQLKVAAPTDQPIMECSLPVGKNLICIKDFSELSDEKRINTLKDMVTAVNSGKYCFVVANTGPIINTFGDLFETEEEKESAKMDLIEAMDANKGDVQTIHGYPLTVINVAAIDNAGFAEKFLEKIQTQDLWQCCEDCKKKKFCHIFTNHKLICENKDRVNEFIRFFYTWLAEYGKRLTIRSMTEHLAYMFTGADDCEDIGPNQLHKKLFTNLFFGYEGIVSNPFADNILAVRMAKESNVYCKRLRSDEELLIRRDYSKVFSAAVNKIIDDVDTTTLYNRQDWDIELRRMYLFLNIKQKDSEEYIRDIEDIFSKQFYPYYKVRNEHNPTSLIKKELITDALRMIYTDTAMKSTGGTASIPITMSTGSGGIGQSVQLIAGILNMSDLEIRKEYASEMNQKKNNLYLVIKKENKYQLTLPMLNHFEELRDGVIATNIDPQLSHGIENLKSTLLQIANDTDDRIEMLVLNNTGYSQESIKIENGIVEVLS